MVLLQYWLCRSGYDWTGYVRSEKTNEGKWSAPYAVAESVAVSLSTAYPDQYRLAPNQEVQDRLL